MPSNQQTARVLWAGVLTCCLLAGCGETPPPVTTTPGKPLGVHQGAKLTQEECDTWAAALQQAVQQGEVQEANRLVDWQIILEQATAEVPCDEEVRQGFLSGVLDSVGGKGGLAADMVGLVADGGKYQKLSVNLKPTMPSVLFRVLLPNGAGVNYHEFALARREDGKVRAVEIDVFLSGETISRSLRRFYIPVVVEAQPQTLESLQGWEHELARNREKIGKLRQAVEDRRPQAAQKIYQELSPGMKADVGVLLLRLQAAQQISDAVLIEALDEARKHQPNKACWDMLGLEAQLADHHYAAALQAVARVKQAVGADAHLETVTANIHLSAGQLAEAQTAAEAAIRLEPTLEEPYWVLLTLSLRQKNYPLTVQCLTTLEEKFSIDFTDLFTLAEYAEFLRSPNFREWRSGQRVRP